MKKTTLLIALLLSLVACQAVKHERRELTPTLWEELEDSYLALYPHDQSKATALLQPLLDSFYLPATETVRFPGSENFSISFDVPYNSLWGGENYILSPYWDQENAAYAFLSFGPIEGMEGGFGRACTLFTKDPANLETAFRRLLGLSEEEQIPVGKIQGQGEELELRTMNGTRVLWTYGASFPTINVEIEGNSENFQFTCWNYSPEEIIQSIEM